MSDDPKDCNAPYTSKPLSMKKPTTPDEYISSFREDVQDRLMEIRSIIKNAAPDATEVISYSMPAFKLGGMLVWYGAHTTHIGFYPRASGIEVFQKELTGYKTSKGAVQFPFDRPLPRALITKMVKYRVKENLQPKTKKTTLR